MEHWKTMDIVYVLGTPETKRSGLKTLNALKAFTSNIPSGIIFCRTALNALIHHIKYEGEGISEKDAIE